MRTRRAPKQRIQNGIRICRNCDKPVAKGRISYCSDACAEDFAIKYFPGDSRRHVFKRDVGVCQKCGCDTEKLRRILKHVRGYYVSHKIARELGFHGSGKGELWQADHVVECINGGWGKGLENFRTLCTPCHKAETKRLAAEIASRRRAEKSVPLFDLISEVA